jgi:SWI/SNF-related matrix-associated actin-dependent regulator 1 of chromatin subfamily A
MKTPPKKRAFSRGAKGGKPQWARAPGPVGSLFQLGNRITVQFEYSPQRVKAVKSIPGARFSGDEKSWSIPVEQLGALQESKEFPVTGLLIAPITPQSELRDPSEALGALRQNPFLVPEDVIASVPLDLLVRLAPEKRRLRVIPTYTSKAHKLVKKMRGALFSAYDSAYSIPTEILPELLKKLRDAELLFAVDEVAGKELKSSAPLRAQLVQQSAGASVDELSAALLVPIICEVADPDTGDLFFRPSFFTTEQFRLAFPGVQRKGLTTPFTCDSETLLRFIGRSRSLPFKVWLTAGVHSHLERKRSSLLAQVTVDSGPVDDGAAEVLELPAIWRVNAVGRGTLALDCSTQGVARLLAARAVEVLELKNDSKEELLVFDIPDSKIPTLVFELNSVCDAHDLPPVPQSKSFASLHKDIEGRVRQREATSYYTSLSDLAPSELPELDAASSGRLFPHQRVAVRWLLDTPHAFLGDDMGLGKTLSVLSYYSALKHTLGFELLLVVCPNSLTRNWLREISMWFPHIRATVLSGDKNSKAWALRLLTTGSMEYDALILNYEAMRLEYVTPEIAKLTQQRRTLLCLDESQRVKNHSSKTFKALSEVAPHSSRRVLLSGTPTPKDVTDLWAQMRILDGGVRFGKSFYKWLGRVAELGTEFSEFAVKKFIPSEINESVLRVHEVMLRRRKERVVNLPEKTFVLRECQLTGSQLQRYEEIREGLILRMRSTSGEQFVREITNILEEYLRAVQVASNPRLIDPEWKGTPAKFLELDEIVNEVVKEQEQKLVIWTNYLGNVRELAERYAEFGAAQFSGEVPAADREATVRAFQEKDSPKIIVAVPAAGGVGITLTAAQTAVYIDKTWNAEHWMQSVDRLHRIGQTGTVTVISLLACKVDEVIHWNLRRKERAQAEILGDERGRQPKTQKVELTREELLEALKA